MKQRPRSYYTEEQKALIWDRWQQEELAATADMVAQRKAMLDLLNLNAGEHVLDVGSGNGIFVREVLEIVGSNGHACGIDISEIMVGLAQNICPGAVFVKGDATDLPGRTTKITWREWASPLENDAQTWFGSDDLRP